MTTRFQSLFADPYGAPTLIRRLLADHALRHRKLYIAAFLMMGVAAACTALSAYLLGDVVNQAYVHKNFQALVHRRHRGVRPVRPEGRGDLRAASHHDADRQPHRRRQSAAHVRQAADREHRLLLRPAFIRIHRAPHHRRDRHEPRAVAADHLDRPRCPHPDRPVRRDGDPGSGDVARRPDHRAARDNVPAQAGAARARDHQGAVHRRHADDRDLAGDAAGPARRQGVHAGRRNAPPLRYQRVGGAARGRQVGARREPRQPADGDARRPRDRACHHLQRVSDHLQRRGARRLHLVPRRVPARL